MPMIGYFRQEDDSMKKMRKGKKNKGFTLVELIIAAAIMAIIVAPLLGNFVQSAKINQKARENLNGMNMAQDFMEGIASYTGDEVINMFESGASLSGTILPATTAYSSHGDIDAAGNVSFESAGGAATGTPVYSLERTYDATNHISRTPVAADEYHFFVKGVQMGGHTYDYDVKLKSIIKNKKAQASTIDKTYDAVYSAPEAFQESINDPIKGFVRNGASPTDLTGRVKRRITVRIKVEDHADADPDNDEYPVTVTDEFVAEGVAGLSGTGSIYQVTDETNIFANAAAKQPESVYIYYPASIEGTASVASEEFWIENKTNNDVNVFLIRQKNITPVYNSVGSASVYVSDEGSDGKLHTYLITNARFDLNHNFSENLRTKNESGQSNDDEYLADMYGITYNVTEGKYEWPSTSFYDKSKCEFKYRRGTGLADGAGYQIIQDTANGVVPAYNDIISDGIMKRDSAAAFDVEIVVNDVSRGNKKVASYEGALSN